MNRLLLTLLVCAAAFITGCDKTPESRTNGPTSKSSGMIGVSLLTLDNPFFKVIGDHITSDISKGLQVPLAQAERIKTFYGGVVATGMDDREMIEMAGDCGDWERDRRRVSRSELIGTEFHEMLRCIRCGACLNHCPVYRTVGGHAYGWVYSGPMGAVLIPGLIGIDAAGHLPNASTLCGRCESHAKQRQREDA